MASQARSSPTLKELATQTRPKASEATPANTTRSTFTQEMISVRAYEIFLRGGSVAGNDKQNWFQAIEELTAETQVTLDEPLDTTSAATGRMPTREVPRRRTLAA
jgi:hypothetical protein